MTKKDHPEYHKALMEQSTYPSATRRIKFEETRRSYLYRTGTHFYKIRKSDHFYSSLAIKERYAREVKQLGAIWAEGHQIEVFPVVNTGAGYQLHGETGAVDYGCSMVQFQDSYWLDRLVKQEKVSPAMVGRLARFLVEIHQDASLEEKAASAGRPENFHALMDEIFYEARKYVGITISDAILELVSHAMLRYVEEFRRLFLRRQKRGRIVEGHGAFIPSHIHLKGGDVLAISPLEGQSKFRLMDAANDVATLLNELDLAGALELGELFQKRYASTAKDRDLARILPAYRTLQAMRSGLLYSEWLAELAEPDKSHSIIKAQAESYFNLAVRMARTIPRPD